MKIIKRIFIGLIFLMLFSGGFLYSYIGLADLSKSKTDEEIAKAQEIDKLMKDERSKLIQDKEIKNILLLGTDNRPGETVSRTDTMLLLTLDGKHNKIKLTSLMRDVLVDIPTKGKSKLNHSYMWGGIDLLKATIERNYKLKIDNYAVVDFSGFKKVVDLLGGVTVDVKESELDELNEYILQFPDEDTSIIEEEGTHTLTGAQALGYVRIRYNTGGELERNRRQRDVIDGLVKNLKNTSISKYPALIKTGLDYVDTDMKISDMMGYAQTVLEMDIEIETAFAPFMELCIDGIYDPHGWVFRTDLDVTSDILVDYIYEDIPIEESLKKVNKNSLNYTS